jgi:hypothetical protein
MILSECGIHLVEIPVNMVSKPEQSRRVACPALLFALAVTIHNIEEATWLPVFSRTVPGFSIDDSGIVLLAASVPVLQRIGGMVAALITH